MTVPPASASTGCPGIETLAAFAEGRLDAAAHEVVVRHLADCDDCREIVAETVALRAELVAADAAAGAPAAPIPFPRAKPAGVGMGVALAAALVLVAGVAFLLTRAVRPSSSATLAALAAQSRAPLDQDWDEPLWSVTRGEGPDIADAARAFRLGVRSADLEFALHSEDRASARRFAAEIVNLVAGVPLADPVAQVFRELAAGVERDPAEDSLERARLGTELAREAVDPELFDLGRWAETGRLVTTTAAPLRLPRFPGTPAGTEPELAGVAADLEKRARGSAPAPELAEEFSRLVARGGDLR